MCCRLLIGLIFFLMAFPAKRAVAQQIKITPERDQLQAKKGETTKVTIEVDVATAGFLFLKPDERPPPDHPDKDPIFEVTVRSGKFSWVDAEPPGAAEKVKDSPFEFTVKRDRASGGKRAKAKVILQYETDNAPPPGELLIVVNGRQGLVLLGEPQQGSRVYEGLGRLNLLPVSDSDPTTGPVLQSPFAPTPQAVNPTAEMVNRAGGIAIMLGTIAVISTVVSRRKSKLPPGTRPAPIPVARPVAPHFNREPPPKPIVRNEQDKKGKPAPQCQLSLHLENPDQVYVANGNPDNGVRLVVKASHSPGWDARIVQGSLRVRSSHPGGNPMSHPQISGNQATLVVPLPFLWEDSTVTVTLEAAAVQLEPGDNLRASGAETTPWQTKKSEQMSQDVHVRGANPKVIVEANPAVIDATGSDHTTITVKEFWLFYQKVPTNTEIVIVKRAKGTISNNVKGTAVKTVFQEEGGEWTPPFLIGEQDSVEAVRLEVICLWTGGSQWQSAMDAHKKKPFSSQSVRFYLDPAVKEVPASSIVVKASSGFAVGSAGDNKATHELDRLPFEPCEVLLRGCSVSCNTITKTFWPLPDMPLYAKGMLKKADGSGVPNPFQGTSPEYVIDGKTVHDDGAKSILASKLLEVLDLTQGPSNLKLGEAKVPPSMRLDLPGAELRSSEEAMKKLEDAAKKRLEVFWEGEKRLGNVKQLGVYVDDNGKLFTTARQEKMQITTEYGIAGAKTITIEPSEPILFLGPYKPRANCDPIHDGPFVYHLVIDDGLGGKAEVWGNCRAALGALVLETGGPDMRVFEYSPHSFELTYQPATGYLPFFENSGDRELKLTWEFAVVNEEGTPLQSAGWVETTMDPLAVKSYLVVGHTPDPKKYVTYINKESQEVLWIRKQEDNPAAHEARTYRRVEKEDREWSSQLRSLWHKLFRSGEEKRIEKKEKGLLWLPVPGKHSGHPRFWMDRILLLAVRVEMRDRNRNLLATSDRLMSSGRTPPEFVWRDHRFGFVLLMLRFCLTDYLGRPISDKKYVLEVKGEKFPGDTGAQGVVEQLIPPDAEEGKLAILDGVGAAEKAVCEFILKLGLYDAAAEVRGAQARLNNLSLFASREVDGKDNEPQFKRAIDRFQFLSQLALDSRLEGETVRKLETFHQRGVPTDEKP
jgi:hypothetical protein